jgi:phosphinothricin acetyltransferase
MRDEHLRIATADDAIAIASIYGPYVRDSPVSFEGTPPTIEEVRGRIDNVLASHVWLVACRGGDVIGYAYATAHRARTAYRWSVDTAVYLESASQRRGIARRLYGALFEILARQRYVNAYAGISLPNPASVAFHEAMGFVPVGVYQRVGYKHGAWRDVGWWSRTLRECDGEPEEPLGLRDLDADVVASVLASD